MKKIILLLFVLLSASRLFANFTQLREWRWRKNDGSQTTATWIAAQNVAITINDRSTIRLRGLISNPTNDSRVERTRLYYSTTNSTNDFTTYVDTVGANGAPFKLAAISTPVADRDPTTAQLISSNTNTYSPGKVYTRADNDSVALPGSAYVEIEWAITPTSSILTNTTYYFKLNGLETPSGFTLPNLTTAAALPVSLLAFSGKTEGSVNKITWQTASEQNFDRFEVEYSTDGVTWAKIATVKGTGTSSTKTDYSITHTTPAKGSNYYRLKQVDFDGKSSYSAVINIKLNGVSTTGLQVYPNPVHQDIFFTISNPTDKAITAVLYDAQGKALLTKTITTQPGTTTYKMEGNGMLLKGVYILQLQGKQTKESVLVNVE